MVFSLRTVIVRRLCAKSFSAYADSLYISISVEDKVPSVSNQHELQSEMVDINSRLKHLVQTGDLRSARHMFDGMPHRDEISWTTMISGYVKASDSSEALSLFSQFWVCPSTRVDQFILSLALKACGQIVDLKYGETLHGFSVKSGLVNSVFVGSSMLDMYMKNGRVFEGCRFFDEMPLRNVVSWTAMKNGRVSGRVVDGSPKRPSLR